MAQPAAHVGQKPAPSAASSAGTPASGNSASFEAALAAIRAAWAKPESTTPRAAAPASPVKSLTGSGEVDLTSQIDPREDVTGANGRSPATDGDALEDANTSKARRKLDKPGKRPEKPKARRTSGADDRDGRTDWGVFDPNQYEMSALVNKLDEVTDSDEVGAHTRAPRATNRR
jgi:hypothetical protein